jgi:hypothetical protein
MTRVAHYLKGHKSNQTPSRCIWFDTETKPKRIAKNKIEHVLTFGWAAFSRKTGSDRWRKPSWCRFTTPKEMYGFISDNCEPKTKLYVFCHNTSFDLPVTDIFKHMSDLGFTLYSAIIDAPPTILTFKRGNETVVFLDTLNIFRMSLKELGKRVGLEKLDMPDVTVQSKEADIYCKRDVEIIMRATIQWYGFIKDHDLGGFSPTLASQAFRAYRHRFMPTKILIDSNEQGTALSREGYYGGRVECFRLGIIKEPISHLDVNSMFASAMRDGLYPACRLWNITAMKPGKLEEYLKKYCIMARVTLNTDLPIYAQSRKDGLFFPVGRFDTVLSTPELEIAVQRGHIEKVIAATVYTRADIFTDFVKYFHDMRRMAIQTGNTTEAFLLKQVLVSLYGKFGQRGIIWESDSWIDDLTTKAWDVVSFKTGVITKYRQLGGLVQQQHTEAEGRDSHPAIAAHVTAYARVMLWNILERAGRENVYYCDTDCVVVNAEGRDRLNAMIDPDALGMLKVEGEYEEIELRGPKDYRLGDSVKIKGVKKNALWLAPNIAQQEQWSSLKGWLNKGSTGGPTTTTIQKELKRIYKKGTVSKNGTVQPFVLTC